MQLWQNLPFAMILLPLASASLTSILKGKAARRTAIAVITLVTAMAAALVILMQGYGQSYTFMMGHFPAPWGNEIRAGMLEAVTALCFALVMLFSVLGGLKDIERDILPDRQNLYFVMCELTTAALMAQVFTNDVFTGYVFLEIMTIAACALISARTKGRTLVAATRYMIMNLVGSGLFLLSLTLLYDLTGHLLMSNIQEKIVALSATGKYQQPLTMVIALVTIGLGIKSALFPFHTWVPDAYSSSTPTSSAILSSLISKGYIFLLIKFYYRVFGLREVVNAQVEDVLLVFGAAGAVIGSVLAIRQLDIRRMIAYSSMAQIGYIYMAIGLGTQSGMTAALFQLMAHAICKSLLFIATGGLCAASKDKRSFPSLRGAAYRHPVAGAAFVVGALSMIGIPFLSGFAVKLAYAEAAVLWGGPRMITVLSVLAVSTMLNAIYFGRTVVTLFRLRAEQIPQQEKWHGGPCFALSCAALSLLTFILGLAADPVLAAIRTGLDMFS